MTHSPLCIQFQHSYKSRCRVLCVMIGARAFLEAKCCAAGRTMNVQRIEGDWRLVEVVKSVCTKAYHTEKLHALPIQIILTYVIVINQALGL